MVMCFAARVREKERKGLSYSKSIWGRGRFVRFHRLLYCPGKSSVQNGISHPYWVKIWDETITVKLIYAPNKNSKFFLLQAYLIKKIRNKKQNQSPTKSGKPKKKKYFVLSTVLWLRYKDCPYRLKNCLTCDRFGHKSNTLQS